MSFQDFLVIFNVSGVSDYFLMSFPCYRVSFIMYLKIFNMYCSFNFAGDWHRYNLKRKVASLAIISVEEFEKRKEAHEIQIKVDWHQSLLF
jgi:hypothetical protein